METNDQQLTNRNLSHLNAHLPSRRILLHRNTYILGHLRGKFVENSPSPRAVTLLRKPRTSSKPQNIE
jgi:hypothetical protein